MEQKTNDPLMITTSGGKMIIYGCGGHARSILNTIYGICEKKDIVLVDKEAGIGERILGCKTEQEYVLTEKDGFIVAIGDNKKREIIYRELREKQKGYCISIVSRSSDIGVDAKIGYGTYIAPNVYIGPQVEVGDDTIINTGGIIEHETMIGSHTHIAPHATICGRSKIGDHVFCGAGSTVIDGISVCDGTIIGAGAVVVRDIFEAGIYIGIPAKKK